MSTKPGELQPGGYGLSLEIARRMKDAGIKQASVSVDGLEATHDRIRGRAGSFASCFRTFSHFREVGLYFTANTQVNRLSAPELPELYERLRDAGARAWQIQLTLPMGNGADNAWLILQPAGLDDFYKVLARVVTRALAEGKVAPAPANDIGYYGPYDALLWRALGSDATWLGCQAGLSTLGIHANGEIKGCPTLPSEFVGGNIRTSKLDEIVETRELMFNAEAGGPRGTEHMWGYCASCKYAEVCRGGCTQMAAVVMGKRGNNPYCHHRAVELAKRGLRERVVPRLLAIGKQPFDHGEFRLIEEPLDAAWPAGDEHHFTYERVVWPAGWELYPVPASAGDTIPAL